MRARGIAAFLIPVLVAVAFPLRAQAGYRLQLSQTPRLEDSSLVNAKPPTMDHCGPFDEPVGYVRGSGEVTYMVTAAGTVDTMSFHVIHAENVSEPGLLSVSRRLLAHCRFHPARQSGHKVAVEVRQFIKVNTQRMNPLGIAELHRGREADEMPVVWYCDRLKGRKVHGRLVLRFVIGTDGWAEPGSVEVVSATSENMRNAASRVAHMCRYAPGRDLGQLLRVSVLQGFSFGY